MSLAIVLLAAAVYTYSWVKYLEYQFMERDHTDAYLRLVSQKKCHYWRVVNNLSMFVMLFGAASIQTAVAVGIVYTYAFDVLLNIEIYNKPYYTIVKSSFCDRIFRQLKMSDKVIFWVKTVIIAAINVWAAL